MLLAQLSDVIDDTTFYLIFFSVLGLPLFAFLIGCLLRGKPYAGRLGPYVFFYYGLLALMYLGALVGHGEFLAANWAFLVLLAIGPFFALYLLISGRRARGERRGFEVIPTRTPPSDMNEARADQR